MRWKLSNPKLGDKITKTKFCLLPRRWKDELIWLELLDITYQYGRVVVGYDYVEMWEVIDIQEHNTYLD